VSLLDVDPACLAAAERTAPAPPDALRRVPLFRHPRVDRLLTRTPAWLPFVVYAPFVAGLLVAHRGAGLVHLAWPLLAGVLLWTLVEYLLHRFGLHLPQHTRAWRVAYFLVHGHHHADPRDPERLVAALPQSALLLALVYGLASLALDGPASAALLAGTTLGYLAYEAAHWRIHHARRPGPLLRRLARHHLAHHGDPTSRYGISSPLWDVLLGTLPRARTTGTREG
jgi:sterol desaturase/sphingolipid hydroxylase (fatty acid hydroxylase superfamily)